MACTLAIPSISYRLLQLTVFPFFIFLLYFLYTFSIAGSSISSLHFISQALNFKAGLPHEAQPDVTMTLCLI